MSETPISEKNTGNEELFHLFRQTMMGIARAHHHHGHAHHAQNRVLCILKKDGPMSQRDLMDMLQVRSASLSELLGKLERGGFITRERDPEDKRGYTLSLTPDGDAAATAAEEQRQCFMGRFFTVFSEEERTQLRSLLEKLVRGMETETGPMMHPHGEHPHWGGHGRHHGRGPHDSDFPGQTGPGRMRGRCMRHQNESREENSPHDRADGIDGCVADRKRRD